MPTNAAADNVIFIANKCLISGNSPSDHSELEPFMETLMAKINKNMSYKGLSEITIQVVCNFMLGIETHLKIKCCTRLPATNYKINSDFYDMFGHPRVSSRNSHQDDTFYYIATMMMITTVIMIISMMIIISMILIMIIMIIIVTIKWYNDNHNSNDNNDYDDGDDNDDDVINNNKHNNYHNKNNNNNNTWGNFRVLTCKYSTIRLKQWNSITYFMLCLL